MPPKREARTTKDIDSGTSGFYQGSHKFHFHACRYRHVSSCSLLAPQNPKHDLAGNVWGKKISGNGWKNHSSKLDVECRLPTIKKRLTKKNSFGETFWVNCTLAEELVECVSYTEDPWLEVTVGIVQQMATAGKSDPPWLLCNLPERAILLSTRCRSVSTNGIPPKPPT